MTAFTRGELGDFAIHNMADSSSLVEGVRREIQAIDPLQPVSRIRPLETVLTQSVSDRRMMMIALGSFAAIALILALVGVYRVLSHAASSRTAEIGLRLALGAQPGVVLRMVLGHGLRLVLAGVGLGITLG